MMDINKWSVITVWMLAIMLGIGLLLFCGCALISPVSEYQKLKEEFAKKESDYQKEIADKDESVSQIKAQIKVLNEKNQQLENKLQALIGWDGAVHALNYFQWETLRFLGRANIWMLYQWILGIIIIAAWICIFTEIAGCFIAWNKILISFIPLLIAFGLTFLILKADLPCAITLNILGYAGAHAGWALLINDWKLHKPVKAVITKLGKAVANFGDERSCKK